MRRIYLVLIGVTLVLCGLAIYVFLARPVLVLPTVTVPVSENNTMGAYQRQLKINELNVILRTDGKLAINADGQQLARLSYTPVSLNNTKVLALQTLLPQGAIIALRPLQFLFPALTSNVYLTGLCLYYVLPVEITIRFVRG